MFSTSHYFEDMFLLAMYLFEFLQSEEDEPALPFWSMYLFEFLQSEEDEHALPFWLVFAYLVFFPLHISIFAHIYQFHIISIVFSHFKHEKR